MMEKFKLVLKEIYTHKFKFVLMVFSAIVFTFFLFPFDDLGDLVTAQVSKLTGGQVYLQFNSMNVGVLNPGLQLRQVYLETANFPPLTALEITVTPSVSSLINKKPAGSVAVTKLFNGNLEVSLKSGGKSDTGVEKQKIQLSAKKMSLSELKDLLSLPISIKGNLDVTSSATVDFAFQEQPDADINLHVDKFELPTGNVNTPMGPLTLPELKLSSLDLEGRLSAGKFQISNAVIGKEGDDLRGTVKGGLFIQMRMNPDGVLAIPGAYDFSFDLSVKKSLQDRAALFLSFLDQYKTATPDGARFVFKISATNPMGPPNIGVAR